MGYIASRIPSASLIVVANDRGYEPMLVHAREMGFSVRQVGHRKPTPVTAPSADPTAGAAKPSAPAAKKVAAKKSPAKAAVQAAAKKTPAKKATPAAKKKAKPAAPAPSKKVAPAKKSSAEKSPPAAKTSGPTPGAMTKHLTDSLRKMGDKRPTKPKSLWRTLKSLLGPDSTDEAVEIELDRLIKTGVVRVDSEKGVTYPAFAA
jgi:hypothetical protein